MDTSGWPGRSGVTALGALSIAVIIGAASPAYAQVSDNIDSGWMLSAPADNSVSYDTAADHYNAGRYAQALVYAKTAGEQGHVLAQLMAGQILRSGNIDGADFSDAAQWFARAAQGGNSDAMLALGDMALKGEGGLTPSDAQGYFKDAAALGRNEAMQALSVMYQSGRGVDKNPEQAAIWLSKAAAQGDAGAAKKRGDLLIETDPKGALKAYEHAAALGNSDAAYAAAILYVENIDIRPNEARSAELMHQAARAGHGAAMADYGLYVYQGLAEGGPAQAAQWFARAANSGDDQGKFLYAFTLAKGEGVTQSYEEAYYWLLKIQPSGIDLYDKDYRELKTRLEDNVDPAILDKARARLAAEG